MIVIIMIVYYRTTNFRLSAGRFRDIKQWKLGGGSEVRERLDKFRSTAAFLLRLSGEDFNYVSINGKYSG